MIKVLVVGSAGRMGKSAVTYLTNSPLIQDVFPVTRHDDLKQVITEHKPHVALELTDKDSVFTNSLAILKQSIPLVIGASGLSNSQKEQLNSQAKKSKIPCLIVPNFSLAAELMNQAAKIIAPYLVDCEIIERHHKQKKDAPSATSLHTAEVIRQAYEENKASKSNHSEIADAQDMVSIHSIRSSGVLAQQDVIFAQDGESLTISLSQISREAFMPGIVVAVTKVSSLDHGVHTGIHHVLDIRQTAPSF